MAALSFKRYVNVTSGVIGAGGTVPRALIGRLFTSNQRMDADEVLEFETSDDVGDYFGFESPEYNRARFYFGWVSPAISKARKISFARYVPTGVPPRIFGGSAAPLSTITTLGRGTLVITIGTTAYTVQDIDVSTDVTSYSDLAVKLQDAIQAVADDQVVKACSVLFDSTNTSFVFTGGEVSNDDISVSSSELSQLLAWNSGAPDALLLAGHVATSVSEAIELADSISNNYASVAFIDQLAIEDHVKAAQTLNSIDDSSYMYCVACQRQNYKAWQSKLAGIAGVAIGLIDDYTADQFPTGIEDAESPSSSVDNGNYVEMCPMIQMAATDYSRRNATSSYMYREFDLPATVSDNDEASDLDKLRINYYGKTQEAGRTYAFYQKGYLQGPATAPIDQSVFANEIWLKSEARVEFMDLLRTLQELPANESGRTFGLSTLQGLVDKALRNGVISVGKTLDVTQRAAIAQISGDPDAWRQVQSIGYWMNVEIESFVNSAGVREYKLTYTLIYSKKDVVRSITGTHALV